MNKIAKQNIYFLGIGGIGMSALARYFYNKGCYVSGYDKTPSPLMKLSHAHGATQDGRAMVERSDGMWSTGEGNGKPLQYSCLENPMTV